MEAAQAGLPLTLPGPRERHGKLASKRLPWMWSFTRRLVHPRRFPVSPLGMQAAGGSRFKGQAGQEKAREVWEVAACHVGKQAPARDKGSWCGAGQEVPAPALLTVHRASLPGKDVGFARCHQRHNRLRNLGGTTQVLAMAPSPLQGHAAGWLGQAGGDAGGPSLQAGFGEAPQQTWRGCRKPGPRGETKRSPAALWSPRGP